MKRIILCGIMVLCFMGVFAQKVTVIDADNGQRIPLVNIISTSQNVFLVTDGDGQADVSGLEKATDIEFKLLGYETFTTSYDDLETKQFELIMYQSSITLDHVVISAAKWSQTSREVPAKVSVITPKDIALHNPQTAADLLGSTGEVFIQKSQQGGGSPMIRGFSTNRLLISVDGVRMNTAIFRSGNVQNVISIDPFATESAEVLFGPGSVIYGSDAIGGVMSFRTLTPNLSSQYSDRVLVSGEALSRYSSANNERTAHFHVNLGWKKWAMVTSFSTFNFDDLQMGSNGPDDYLMTYRVQRVDSLDRVFANENPEVQTPSAYSQVNLMQKVRFKPNEHWDMVYAFHYSETSDYGRYDRHNRIRGGLPRYAQWDYGPQIWMMNNLSIHHLKSNFAYEDFTLRVAHQQFEESRISRGLNRDIRANKEELVDALSVNADFRKALGTKNKLFYGLEGVINEVNSIGTDFNIVTLESTAGAPRYPESTWSSYAGYVTLQRKWSNKLLTQVGTRYNQFLLEAQFNDDFYPFPFSQASINDGALTGSLGLVFTPTRQWNVTLNLSTGFRSPNVDDVGKVFDSEPGAVVVPNPDLSSEYVYNAELDVARVFGKFLKLDATTYYTLLNNALVRRDFTLNGMDSIVYDGTMSQVQAIQNAASASVFGVQAGMEARLGKGFSFSGHVNYQRGREELADGSISPSRHAAPMFATARIKYNAGRFSTQLFAVYNAQVSFEDLPVSEHRKTEIYALDGNGNPYSPDWYTLNFKAVYQVSERIQVSGGVENITDQRYRPYSSGLAGAGRNVIVSGKVLF